MALLVTRISFLEVALLEWLPASHKERAFSGSINAPANPRWLPNEMLHSWDPSLRRELVPLERPFIAKSRLHA